MQESSAVDIYLFELIGISSGKNNLIGCLGTYVHEPGVVEHRQYVLYVPDVALATQNGLLPGLFSFLKSTWSRSRLVNSRAPVTASAATESTYEVRKARITHAANFWLCAYERDLG
jgi:hypothetical protein